MKKILFVRSKDAFLPEIDAYISYLNKNTNLKSYDSSKIVNGYKISDFDIIWEFKGLGGIRPNLNNQLLIHEYASLSTGIAPKFKNFIKRNINVKPNIRIFLNEQVKNGFGFSDDISYTFRDMGVNEEFLKVRSKSKEYDFVYVGEISKSRNMHNFLRDFVKGNNGKLCLIGTVDKDIYDKHKNNKDIIFTGRVSSSEVAQIASKAVYGINYIPDIYPYNIQTSTKLLEYLALDLKVITTDYMWVRRFEESNNCKFYKIHNGYIPNIEKHDKKYEVNLDMNNFKWDNIIEESNIKNLILSSFK